MARSAHTATGTGTLFEIANTAIYQTAEIVEGIEKAFLYALKRPTTCTCVRPVPWVKF